MTVSFQSSRGKHTMPLVAQSRNHWTSAWIDARRTGASDAIAQLKAGMIGGRSLTSGGKDPASGFALGTIEQVLHPSWRIDRQRSVAGLGDLPGKFNLQVQP